MKALFVLGIVLALFTYNLAEESSQNEIQKRNGGESLPRFNYYHNMRQTTVNHEPRVETWPMNMNNMAHEYQQQSDWEVQKFQAQAQRFQGSPQYQQYKQPWIPQPDYVQHNHINQHQQNQQTLNQQQNHHLNRQQQIKNNNHINHQQQSQHYQHQYQQPAAILYQPVVTQYQKPQMVPVHKVVYPVPVQMRPPPPPAIARKVQPAVVVQKAIPIYVGKHIVYHHVPKPVAVPAGKPFPVYMDHQPGKPLPVMQVIIRDDGNHNKMPFWG